MKKLAGITPRLLTILSMDAIKDNGVDNELITDDSNAIKFELKGELTELIERMDIMNRIPQFVKNIVSGVTAASHSFTNISQRCSLTRSDVPRTHLPRVLLGLITYITDERGSC